MSTIVIAIVVTVLLAALVGYAVISQSADQKRKQKQRLVAALKTRARNFKHMLSGFPPDFLTKELVVLVHKCLIDVYEQLSKLEPETGTHLKALQLYTSQMQEVQNKPKSSRPKTLQNPQQVKEVRRYLQELNKFIAQLEARRGVSREQGELYRRQIKQLVLQISVDAYTVNAKQAQQGGKTRLAIHYYSLAYKLLARENGDGTYQQQLTKLGALIKELEAKAAEEEPQTAATEEQLAEQKAVSAAWDNFGEDESWKKKKIYD